jgi:hypothetical protein
MRTLIPMLLAFVAGFFAVRFLAVKYVLPAPANFAVVPAPAGPAAKAPSVVPVEPAPVAPEPVVLATPTPVATAVPADPQAELATAIADLHDRLQGPNPLEVMMQYMAPSVLKSMSAANLAQLKAMYADGGQPGTTAYEYVQYTIRMLHSIQGTEPPMNNVADIATFPVTVAPPAMINGGRGPSTIKFMLEDGRWYVR